MPQKYEQEIDEILRRMDARLPRESLGRRLRRGFAGFLDAVLVRITFRPTPTGLLLAGLAVAFLGVILRAFFPGVGTPLTVLALVLFVGALVLSVFRSRRRRTPGWRGRSIDYRSSEPLIWTSLVRRYQAWRDSRRRRSHY
jgi:hypothetical protein